MKRLWWWAVDKIAAWLFRFTIKSTLWLYDCDAVEWDPGGARVILWIDGDPFYKTDCGKEDFELRACFERYERSFSELPYFEIGKFGERSYGYFA